MNDLQKFLKCFQVIKKYELYDYSYVVDCEGFSIEECLNFLSGILKSSRCKTEGDCFYCMVGILSELVDRTQRVIKKNSNLLKNSLVDFCYEYSELEKIVIKSKDYKKVINSIVNHFDKNVDVFFKIDE